MTTTHILREAPCAPSNGNTQPWSLHILSEHTRRYFPACRYLRLKSNRQ
ncbi:TPA: nitroreductase family protein [Raoultella ornithinolytica]|nr:nitroreductase family protein [Raoultella ornithinolytica]HDT6554968.1 nitroreductase family protein [Raoultella ornithinolytica]